MNYPIKILIEAFVVALSIVILGYIIQHFLGISNPLLLLFVTGFLVHLIYDLLGFNKYYCQICAGCK
jgi:hypothetical protein